ncbi:MFS transporter [Candidatus Gracilibacteria bacterium]|nr:MFS transporter [Candidatus Gracilibacteria bacterium]
MNKEKILIALTVLVDVIGIGIVIPVLPFYVQSFGAKPLMITLLFAVFSFFAFISAPFLGSLSDKIGRRPVLIISILSTAIGWIIFAAANQLWILFLGRIIDGMAAGNLPIAQSYLTDISKNDKERTENLGLIGAMFGIGFIIGPMIGGLLSSVSHSFPFWIVGALAFVNSILVFFFLPETNKNIDKSKKLSLNPMMPIIKAVKNKKLLPSYIIWFFFGLAAVGMQSVFSLFLEHAFGYGAFTAGIFMTMTGVIIAINQGVALKHFWLKKFKESNLTLWLMPIFGIGYLLMGIELLPVFLFGLLIITFSQSVLRVTLNSQIAGSASQGERGEVMGILAAVMSLSTIIGPIIAGYVFEIQETLPFIISGIYAMIAFGIIFCIKRKMQHKVLPEDINVAPQDIL